MNSFRNKKKAHTKAESERKDKVVSVRFSPEQLKKATENAKSNDMTLSNYTATAAANGGVGPTPEQLVQFQNKINALCKTVEETAPDKVEEIQKEAYGLWPISSL